MTEFDLVVGLRRAIHAGSVRGSRARQHDHHRPDFPLSYTSVERVEDRQTMLCRGVAQWLYQVYRAVGPAGVHVEHGSEDGPSHVMTFVRISHAGRPVWSMQDAYLNSTYVDSDRPLCLSEIYRLLAERQFARIQVAVSPRAAPVSLRQIESDPRRFEIVRAIAARQGVEIRTPSEDVVHLEWNYDSFPFDPFRRLLNAHFGSDALVLLLALPFGTSGEPYAEEFKRIAEDVRNRLTIRP